jgi:hypothetical protein
MLQLFHSIFGAGGRDAAPYPEELIRRAIERAVDVTDPRLRALPGYRTKLRAAVIHAIDHVIALVDDDARPSLELRRADFLVDPELSAYFVSAEHAREVLARDPVLNQWLKSLDGCAAEHIVMLLLMQQQERHVFGFALEGDMLRRDVAQTTFSFVQHRLLDPTGAEEDTRLLLKRRAFDHLLALALARIGAAHAERDELERERALLRRKHAALAAGHWSFHQCSGASPPHPHALQRQLDEIESQLTALGAGSGLLKAHLDIVVDVLTQAEHNLWATRGALAVDRMGIKQKRASARAPEISLRVLHSAAGDPLVARLVGIARAELPPPRDLLSEAQRYLG